MYKGNLNNFGFVILYLIYYYYCYYYYIYSYIIIHMLFS